MNRAYCCSIFFKVIICLFLIGLIITFINIGNDDIMVLNIKTFNVPVQENVEIGPRQYSHNEYRFTFKYLDIIHIKDLTQQHHISINRLYYNETSPMGSYFNLYEKIYLSYIVFAFILFLVVLGTFFIPPKNKMERHANSMYHYRCLSYSLLVMCYLPMFILMMFMVTRDLRISLKQESNSNLIIKDLCIDKDGDPFGFCQKNDYSTREIEKEYIMDYNILLNNNKTLHGWDSYTWHDGKMETKMIVSYFIVMVIYVIVVVTIVFEFYKGKNKKKTPNY